MIIKNSMKIMISHKQTIKKILLNEKRKIQIKNNNYHLKSKIIMRINNKMLVSKII